MLCMCALLHAGCTLLATRRMLFALGAARVSAFVTHAAFGPSSKDESMCLPCVRVCMMTVVFLWSLK